MCKAHTTVNHPEFFGVGAPCKVVHGPFLVQSDPAIEVARRAEKVQPCLTIVALIRVVDIGLRQNKNLRPKGVPFDLRTFRFEKVLLACRRDDRLSNEKILTLAGAPFFSVQNRHRGVESWTERDTRCSFYFKLVDDALRPLRWLKT